MKSLVYLRVLLFLFLLGETAYLLAGEKVAEALFVTVLTFLLFIISEAFQKGLSNLSIKTKPAEMEIAIAKEKASEVAEEVAKEVSATRKPEVIKHNTEVIEDKLREMFDLGVEIGKKSVQQSGKTVVRRK